MTTNHKQLIEVLNKYPLGGVGTGNTIRWARLMEEYISDLLQIVREHEEQNFLIQKLATVLDTQHVALAWTLGFREFTEEHHDMNNPDVVHFLELREKALTEYRSIDAYTGKKEKEQQQSLIRMLVGALKLCRDELEENIEIEGVLSSFKIAIEMADTILSHPDLKEYIDND